MILEYDSDLDVLYIKLGDGVGCESQQVEPNVVLDYDRNRQLVGIEIENASDAVDRTCLQVSGFNLAGELPGRKEPAVP